MDEIMVANFMVFHDVVTDEHYDLWIGDEAWEVDYFLHENPEEKRAPYVWLTDFVGWLPMPDGGEREQALTADYNAEMIEQIERFPRVRDRAIFVGEPDDIVPDRFGPGLPEIRAWTEEHYRFSGYVTGFDPAAFADRARAARGARLSAGRAGLHRHRRRLGRRSIAPRARHRRVPRGEAAAAGAAHDRRRRTAHRSRVARRDADRRGSSCGPTSTSSIRHLAACDLAVVQGGLTTTMELAANRRPFLYFPAAPPLRAELPRAPPARALRRRPLHGLRARRARRDRRRDRRGDRRGPPPTSP